MFLNDEVDNVLRVYEKFGERLASRPDNPTFEAARGTIGAILTLCVVMGRVVSQLKEIDGGLPTAGKGSY